ncbi:MAG: hypothetical protein A2017_21815 [Lentisphaerae bacterium GWF2_44_16]|nr:MAG: hypothetical protein A2017_21815 [Lentisphaerae bacterium GWF2_44_16]
MAKHREIYNDIYRKISSGAYKPGDKIPTGNELCKKYGVSRITALRAMNDLEAKGLLKKTAGRGTFISGDIKRTMPAFHLFISGYRDLFYQQMGRAYSRVLMENSALGAIIQVQYNLEYLEKAVSQTLEAGTQGIALMHSGKAEDLKKFTEIANGAKDVPVIIVQRYLEGFSGYQLLVDEKEGGYIATKHLISLGHKKLAYIGWFPENTYSATLRFQGFKDACKEAGIPEKNQVILSKDDLYTITKVKEVFKASGSPTAAVASYEDEAIMAYELISSFDIKIPEDLAFVTIYGSIYSNATEVPFTSVDWPGKEIGEKLAETFLALNKGTGKIKDKIIWLSPTLKIRCSCGANKNISRHEILRHDMTNWR